MSCTNCYNGCSEINSDQCIKYTGIDVPGLGITNGDTLLSIEETIFNYIQSFMIGEEIVPTIDPSILCKIINDNLPICSGCTEIFLNDILTAIIKSVCDLETEIANINSELDILNADYTIGCLTGVTASSDTHAILQAVITNLCTLNSAVSALTLSLNSYVLISALPGLIANYLATAPSEQLISNRMVPYSAVPYFPPLGSLSNFSGSGAGLGIWDRIFLCNGQNFTPDLRGRVLVSVTTVVGGGAFDPEVAPGTFTPNYDFASVQTFGVNQITLTENQIASHTHLNEATVIDGKHTHELSLTSNYSTRNDPPNANVNFLTGDPSPGSETYNANAAINTQNYIDLAESNISVAMDNKPAGGNLPHSNIQPVFACYYIMYIP
jgi:microcystin-dependent protein